MVQKLIGDCSSRIKGLSSNIWLNVRINAKNVAKWDVINKGFDIYVAEEELVSSTMCFYGLDQEAMDTQLLIWTTLNSKGLPLPLFWS